MAKKPSSSSSKKAKVSRSAASGQFLVTGRGANLFRTAETVAVHSGKLYSVEDNRPSRWGSASGAPTSPSAREPQPIQVEALRNAGKALMDAADALAVAFESGALTVISSEGDLLAELREAESGIRVPHEAVVAMLDGAHPVKAMREARGLTQKALAEMIDSSANYISQIENGRPYGRATLRRLAAALDTTTDVLNPEDE